MQCTAWHGMAWHSILLSFGYSLLGNPKRVLDRGRYLELTQHLLLLLLCVHNYMFNPSNYIIGSSNEEFPVMRCTCAKVMRINKNVMCVF